MFAGISGYLVVVLATQALGAERFEAFNVFWAAFFLLSGIIQGLMHETTRGVRALSDDSVGCFSPDATANRDVSLKPAPVRPAKLILPLAAVMVLIVGVTAPLWAPNMFGQSQWELAGLLLAISAGSFVLQSIVGGLLSGSESWNHYAIMVGLEALFRVVAACIAFVAGGAVTAFLVVTVAGIVTTPLMLLCLPTVRSLLARHSDVSLVMFLRRGAVAMTAASAATVLVVGYPVLLRATHPMADSALVSNLLLAVLLTRAPILVPLQAFQNAIVVRFVRRRDEGRRAVLSIILLVSLIGMFGAVAAWLVGPWLFGLMGSGFAIQGNLLAALTFASAVTGALFVTGAAALAWEQHAHYLTGWWLATLICICALVTTPDTQTAVVVSLYAGPLVGVFWHLVFGLRNHAGSAAD